MGGIYPRPDSKYLWIWYYHNGVPKRESSKTTSERKARQLLRLREGQRLEGKLDTALKAQKVTFKELANELIRDYKNNRKKSLERVEISIKRLSSFFGNMKVIHITPTKIKAYISHRKAQGISNGTINRELSALKRMFNLGIELEMINNKPVIKELKEAPPRKGFFERAQYEVQRDALPDYLKAPFTLAYFTGRRESEIFNLTWDQVDLVERILILNPEDTKNDEGRIIPLSYEPYEFIRMQASLRAEYPNCPYVFHRKGNEIKCFRKAWKSACKRAGLEGKLFHDTRRTGVRDMVRDGTPEKVVMAISGHKTRSVFDRYNIVNERDLKEAAKRQDNRQKQVDHSRKLFTFEKPTEVDNPKIHAITH